MRTNVSTSSDFLAPVDRQSQSCLEINKTFVGELYHGQVKVLLNAESPSQGFSRRSCKPLTIAGLHTCHYPRIFVSLLLESHAAIYQPRAAHIRRLRPYQHDPFLTGGVYPSASSRLARILSFTHNRLRRQRNLKFVQTTGRCLCCGKLISTLKVNSDALGR